MDGWNTREGARSNAIANTQRGVGNKGIEGEDDSKRTYGDDLGIREGAVPLLPAALVPGGGRWGWKRSQREIVRRTVNRVGREREGGIENAATTTPMAVAKHESNEDEDGDVYGLRTGMEASAAGIRTKGNEANEWGHVPRSKRAVEANHTSIGRIARTQRVDDSPEPPGPPGHKVTCRLARTGVR